jgi:hypothetical protein
MSKRYDEDDLWIFLGFYVIGEWFGELVGERLNQWINRKIDSRVRLAMAKQRIADTRAAKAKR